MSTFVERNVTCPHCGIEEERTIAESLNGPRIPDVVDAILGGRFQTFMCSGCRGEYVVDSPLVYLDFDAGHWLHMFRREDEVNWAACEAEADRTFVQTMEVHAPPMVRDWASRMVRRTVFGLGALREKLALIRAGLDDASLEAMKLDMLRRTEVFAWRREAPIRLVAVLDDGLRFEQFDSDDVVTVPREWLDHVAEDPEWASARAAVAAGSYVDIGRTVGIVATA